MTILIGDLNAKIGSDNSGYDEVMGRQGLGKINENGKILADFCAFNNINTEDANKNTDLHQQMPMQNFTLEVRFNKI